MLHNRSKLRLGHRVNKVEKEERDTVLQWMFDTNHKIQQALCPMVEAVLVNNLKEVDARYHAGADANMDGTDEGERRLDMYSLHIILSFFVTHVEDVLTSLEVQWAIPDGADDVEARMSLLRRFAPSAVSSFLDLTWNAACCRPLRVGVMTHGTC